MSTPVDPWQHNSGYQPNHQVPPTGQSPYQQAPPNGQSPYQQAPPNGQPPYQQAPPNGQSPYQPAPPNGQSPFQQAPQAQPSPGYSYPDAYYAQGSPYGQQFPQPHQAMPPYGAPYPGAQPPYVSHRSRILAAVLALFLGALGVHNFYLGYYGRGIAQLLITICTLGWGAIATGIWAFIEAIMLFANPRSTDAEGRVLQ